LNQLQLHIAMYTFTKLSSLSLQ